MLYFLLGYIKTLALAGSLIVSIGFLLASLACLTLDIRNNSQLNGLNIPDASLVSVKCTQDVLDLMKIGLGNRAVGATALNERSSRSHRYFQFLAFLTFFG